jgi:PQQ-dependent dehydrogenase (s-GDH family)
MRVLASAIGALAAVVSAAAGVQDPSVVTKSPERFSMRVLTSGFEGPWELAWGPDQQLWVTERQGRRVVRVNPADGSRSVAVTIPEVHQSVSQDGLLGLAFHADLLRGTGNDFVYVVFTYDDAPGPALARRMTIRRYRYEQGARALIEPTDILTGLPTHDDHVGGRLAFGPDRKLYLTIGDQGSNFGANRCNVNHAQDLPTAADVKAKDWSKYQGKILRVDLDGSIPADNPEIGGVRSHIFSYGHRNPLGLVFGPNGRLYESEHGPSSDDEVNLIEAGRNYGWPNVAGYRDDKSYVFATGRRRARGVSLAATRRRRDSTSVRHRAESACHPQSPAAANVLHRGDRLHPDDWGSTIAPGGSTRTGDGIPNKTRCSFSASIRGAVFRLSLAPAGRSISRRRDVQSANNTATLPCIPTSGLYLATDVTVKPGRGV